MCHAGLQRAHRARNSKCNIYLGIPHHQAAAAGPGPRAADGQRQVYYAGIVHRPDATSLSQLWACPTRPAGSEGADTLLAYPAAS